MRKHSLLVRILAVLLITAMLIGNSSCIRRSADEQVNTENTQQETVADITGNTVRNPATTERKDLEQIVEILDNTMPVDDMSDQELNELAEELLSNLAQEEAQKITNLDNPAGAPSVDIGDAPDAYDENGAMTEPFDQVYPEIIEKGEVEYSDETLLIKMANGAAVTTGLEAAGIAALEEIVPLGDTAWYEAKLVAGTDASAALEAVRHLDEVLLAEYNYEIETSSADTDGNGNNGNGNGNKKKPKEQWHLQHCGIPNGYGQMKTSGGDPSVIVAVIDTGVDYDHEDLADNMWYNTGETPDNGIDDDGNGYIDDYYGIDIIAGKGSADDDNGHGTHVAGIIAAQNNKLGVVGIAFNVKIMPIKAAMHNGTLNQADVAKAILYAYEMGAEVINMSFGGTACSIAVQDALAVAYERCVLVASAGNSGYPNEESDYMPALPNYPAGLTYVLGVMSVDPNGVESSFSCWDAYAFNGVEYELYAPGEAIMSTLPNDQYGALSGTSMAAPMVSAIAAILRSEFTDRDVYPTKFIYGQLASTSDTYATCISPAQHTVMGRPHNIPAIVNLETALTELPKPEIYMQEYTIFDSTDLSDKNNGDGVIDAGETIALGLTLRNRWGASGSTEVTIDTLSLAGIEDPYITIETGTVDYGGIGTYSTQDAGKIMTDGLHTGWENPFILTIADDCPNDYIFTLNIYASYTNGLDESDTTFYEGKGSLMETVRSGKILPSIIEEDMVLTSENLYIIPSATVIQQGVTVRVEPGTHIQFWSDDPDDPYAEDYIAYLLVNGNFIVEGTKEAPVYIYPSELMSKYNVEISQGTMGYISLTYADITNFACNEHYCNTRTHNTIAHAERCTFRQNFTSIKGRYLYNGNVADSIPDEIGIFNTIKDSVFYKLGLPSIGSTSDLAVLSGTLERCIFVDCSTVLSVDADATNCVFLGNNAVSTTNAAFIDTLQNRINSNHTFDIVDTSRLQIYYREETGTTYIEYYASSDEKDYFYEYITRYLGGGYAIIETEDELEWITNYRKNLNNGYTHYGYSLGIKKGNGKLLWSDGSEIGEFLEPNGIAATTGTFKQWIIYNGVIDNTNNFDNTLYEIPGKVLPTEITFKDYEVTIDPETAYQITPISFPKQLPAEFFLYESGDENVVTVSETGLVTPVGLGTADVTVYSLDRAVSNYISFEVKDYVALEGIAFDADTAMVAVGETINAGITFTPENTTRKNVVYTSDDENVVKVDTAGNITGVSSGTATITAACEGFTDTISVTAYVKATSLDVGTLVMTAALSDGTAELPTVITNEGAETELVWRSSDTDVADIEDGKLTLKKLGTSAVEVRDARSGLTATCFVLVQEEELSQIKDVCFNGYFSFVLLEDGSLYSWDNSRNIYPTLILTGVKSVATSTSTSNVFLVAKEDGTIEIYHVDSAAFRISSTYTELTGKDIVGLSHYYSSYYAYTADGYAYTWGSNTSGQLGVGTTETVDTPTLINLDGVIDIIADNNRAYFLTSDGKVYGTGAYISTAAAATPTVIAENAVQLLSSYTGATYIDTDGVVKQYNTFGETTEQGNFSEMDSIAVTNNSYDSIGIKDGVIYTFNVQNADTVAQVNGITNATKVFTHMGTHFIATENGMLYGLGSNSIANNTFAGASTESTVTTPVLINLAALGDETVTVTENNLTESVLSSEKLELTFNKQINSSMPKLYADGTQITVQYPMVNMNEMEVYNANGFSEGVEYKLVFEAGTLHAAGAITNAEEIAITFTYSPADDNSSEDDTTDDEIVTEKVVHESVLDESIERILTVDSLIAKLKAHQAEDQFNPQFYGNVILNPISTDTEVTHWLRPLAPTVSTYTEFPFGGNYWGTTNEEAIDLQIVDYADYPTYARLMYEPYLTEAPENTFPFVTGVTVLNSAGEAVDTVGNEQITVRVTFNRDMDTEIPLHVTFGSAYPFADYAIEGAYTDARTWEGTYKLSTIIENGNQYFSISNGCSATEDLELQPDQERFTFAIDTTAAQALIMQGTATDTGIQLTWTQDDFDTLMGYNVYRSDSLNGYYQRLNSTVIPAETMEFFDDTVEPGVVYYYNFTVIKTDLTESTPSGKITIMSMDTMAPDIYHTPVYSAFTGSNLVVSATVKDNLTITYVDMYYRTVGETEWKTIRMNKLNDKFSAIIPASAIILDGLEYYIDAFDGVTHTYKGTSDSPYVITVQEAIDQNSLGDVNGDGSVSIKDALLVLQAISHQINLTEEEFIRADLNGDGELWAAEAMRILDYVNGKVGSLSMS